MENYNEKAIDLLNGLVAIAEDGKEGYENAAKDVEDSAIKSTFLTFAHERAGYASELRQMVRELNGDAETDGGGPLGAMHRVWMDLKSVFTGGDKESIINACITGEESAITEYKAALTDSNLLQDHKTVIAQQLGGIEQALAKIKLYAKF